MGLSSNIQTIAEHFHVEGIPITKVKVNQILTRSEETPYISLKLWPMVVFYYEHLV